VPYKLAMKIILTIFTLLLTLQLNSQETYKAITYNIRYNNVNDGEDKWENRKEAIGNFFLEEQGDFLGLQEVLEDQLIYLDRYLDKYDYIGVGRDDGIALGEFSPLFYDSTKWDKIDHATIWLSETPNEVSMGWDAACNRLVTFGFFKNKTTNDTIAVYNTHFDHKGDIARQESVKTLKEFVSKTSQGKPHVILGDFNMTPTTSMYRSMISDFRDARIAANHHFEEHVGTYNGFKLNGRYKRRIDYVFISDDLQVLQYDCPDLRLDGRHLSDHFPVICIVKRNNGH
jgi:endonuclease/exonuclease/phosphatase family metal-dependent hydrolase